MDVSYAPELIENVIMGEIGRREALGDATLRELYHRRAEPLYDFVEEKRGEMFNKLHTKFFSELGFDKMMRGILSGFPRLKKIRRVSIVRSDLEEEADLAMEEGMPKTILIKLRPESFLDQARLSKTLRHELMHVSDMLDDAFDYGVHRFGSTAEETVVKDKYRLLWDIYIDSRLVRRGIEAPDALEARFAEFERLYQKIPEQHRRRVFEALWGTEKMTHGELLELAWEPRKLLERAGISPDKKTVILLPGMPCPLCRFPTYNWFEISSVEPEVIASIKRDFPAWRPEHGACEQCVELYRARAKGW